MQLDRLDDFAARLMQQGVRVFAVTDEKPSADLTAFLESNGHTFPVFHDTEAASHRAFGSFATPTYFVLDAEGRIRFESHVIDDVIRRVFVLRTEVQTDASSGDVY